MGYANKPARPAFRQGLSRPASQPLPGLSLALVGPGRVGMQFLKRLTHRPDHWQLCAVANSTSMITGTDLDPVDWHVAMAESEMVSDLEVLSEFLARQPSDRRVVIDATADEAVASQHAAWLASGFDVVTANKWALAAPTDDWRQLMVGRRSPGVRYECLATVGAGLPVLDAIVHLRRAGESITRVRGSLSGTMTRLVSDINAGLAPSRALAQAHAEGLTEPDPRSDLDGVDAARKLVILAREAGLDLEMADVDIHSLVPAQLRDVALESFLSRGRELDDFWARCAAAAPGQGDALCFVGQVDTDGRARVGLEKVSAQGALARLEGADNRFEIFTECYCGSPLVIQGPGAGIEVTALALWSGLNRISECAGSGY